MSLVEKKELMDFECPKCGGNKATVFYSMDDSTWLAKEEIRTCHSCGDMIYDEVYTQPKFVDIPRPTQPASNPFKPTVKCPYCGSKKHEENLNLVANGQLRNIRVRRKENRKTVAL